MIPYTAADQHDHAFRWDFSVFLTLICVIFRSPDPSSDAGGPVHYGDDHQYLRIILWDWSLPFYITSFPATLRALGDSNSPLYFLIISAILNIFGDLFYVCTVHAGSNGCAVSTV